MRVLLTPYFSGNQYQDLLIDAISDAGAKAVVQDSPHPLSMFVHRIVTDDIDVLHLHWTHPFFLLPKEYDRYLSRIPMFSVVTAGFAAVFLLQVAIASVLCDRVVWTFHNKMNHDRAYPRIDRSVSLVLAQIVDAVQVWDDATQDQASSILRIPTDRVVDIPHGHYCDRYPRAADLTQKTARERLGIDQDDFVYLYFGRILEYKRIPHLVEVFQGLDLKNATLVVAGSPATDDLESDVCAAKRSDNVVLELDYIPDEAVPAYFEAADVVVFPFAHSFNSGSVLLAMSLGRAVVAPPYGAIPSLDPGGNILYDDLGEGLRQAYRTSRESLHEIGTTNRAYVREHNDWAAIGTEIVTLYRGS